MAKFKIDDWVQITPVPDEKWELWDSKTHPHFCGNSGKITEIEEDPTDPGMRYVKVECYLHSNQGGKAWFSEWFKEDHLILRTERQAQTDLYDQDLKDHYYEAGRKLQEWEASKRKHMDDCLRYVFGPEEKKETPKQIDFFDDSESYGDFGCFTNEQLKEDWEDVDTEPIIPDASQSLFTEEELEHILDMFGNPGGD